MFQREILQVDKLEGLVSRSDEVIISCGWVATAFIDALGLVFIINQV